MAEIPWWFWVFIAPELVIGAIGLVVFLIAAAADATSRRS